MLQHGRAETVSAIRMNLLRLPPPCRVLSCDDKPATLTWKLAVSSGLLGSPLLGTWTTCSADAWSIQYREWFSRVTFPVPASGQEPRHGKLTGHLGGYKGRQPNFHKWARPAYEQEALPTLSLLPGDVAVKVLPGDKMYQAVGSTAPIDGVIWSVEACVGSRTSNALLLSPSSPFLFHLLSTPCSCSGH